MFEYTSTIPEKATSSETVTPIRRVVTPNRIPMSSRPYLRVQSRMISWPSRRRIVAASCRSRGHLPADRCTFHRSKSNEPPFSYRRDRPR